MAPPFSTDRHRLCSRKSPGGMKWYTASMRREVRLKGRKNQVKDSEPEIADFCPQEHGERLRVSGSLQSGRKMLQAAFIDILNDKSVTVTL